MQTSFRSYFLATTATVFLAYAPAHAADLAGSRDHPTISRFKGAGIIEYAVRDFDEAILPIKPMAISPPPAGGVLKVEGKVTTIMYRLPPSRTALEAMRNYEQALAAYKVVFRCAGNDCGRELAGYVGNSGAVVPTGWGGSSFNTEGNRYLLAQTSAPTGDVYVLLYAMQENASNPVTVYEEVVELKPMQSGQVTVLDSAALKRSLEADGKVAVYGIYFDTAKADVKPESKPSLDEMAKLLANQPALKVYIVGHTDNAGTLAGNIDLSQRRADAVVKALTSGYRVDASRMIARGVASLSPVSSNSAEAGRARNRRVELVVQ